MKVIEFLFEWADSIAVFIGYVLLIILDITGVMWVRNYIPAVVAAALLLLLLTLVKVRMKLTALEEDVKPTPASVEESMSKLLEQVPPPLQIIFATYLKEMPKNFTSVVNHHTIQFNGKEESAYKYYLGLTLRNYPQKTIIQATSRPKSDLWKDETILRINREIIDKNRVTIKRLFFLENPGELKDLDTQKILRLHCDNGVDVWTTSSVHPADWKLMMVDKAGNIRIGWKVELDSDCHLKSAEATIEPKKIQTYRTEFGRWMGQAERYRP